MNTSPNLNRWGVSEKALKTGAPTIKGKPIGSGTEYRLGHYPDDESMDHGTFGSHSVQDEYMTATAKITDNKVWGLLKSKEWGPISVVILSYSAKCSECGADINDEGYDHEHIAEGDAYIDVTSFKFHRVDFVDDPAYPQAGMIDLAGKAEDLSQCITLAASYYAASQSKNDRVQGPGGRDSHKPRNLTKKGKKTMTEPTVEELQAELESLTTERDDLKAEVETLNTEIEALKADRGGEDESEEVKALRDEINTIKASQKMDKVRATAQARFDAGVVKDLNDEIERIKGYTAEHLEDLKKDALAIKAEKEKFRRTPKASYSDDEDLDEFEAARKAVAERTIGHYRDSNTLKIGETN